MGRMYVSSALSNDERAEALLKAERVADRERLRDLLIASAMCLVSLVAGLVLLGFAVHTTDYGWGSIAFWGGLLVGNGGVLCASYWLFVRATARGDGM